MSKFKFMDRVITPKHPLPVGGWVLGVAETPKGYSYYMVTRYLAAKPLPFKEEDLLPYPSSTK